MIAVLLAVGSAIHENNSISTSDITSKTRKRKRSDTVSHDRVQVSDSCKDGTPLDRSPPNRRRRPRKTSPKKHFSDESLWISESLRKTQKIKGLNEEINDIRERRAKVLKELAQKEELVVSQIRDESEDLERYLVAWGAEDERVTTEWKKSR